jgi:hypothetical protein
MMKSDFEPVTPALDLLCDAAAFLSHLRANQIRHVGARFLPARALRDLNLCLSVAEPSVLATPTEWRTHRARFIHFTCEAAGLIASMHGLLLPSVHTAHWLGLPRWQQLHLLFNSASADSHELGLLWRAYRLPAWRAAPRQLPMPAVLAVLRSVGDHGATNRRLLKAMPISGLGAEDESECRRDLAAILDYLAWFGAVAIARPAAGDRTHPRIHLTALGHALLGDEATADTLTNPSPPPAPLSFATDLELLVSPSVSPALLYELADYAMPVTARPNRRYRVDPTRIQLAIARHTSLSHIRRFFLNALAVDALPEPLEHCLRACADQRDRLSLHEVTLLEASKAETLQLLLRDWRLRAAVERLIAPNAAIIRPDRAPALARRLAGRGLLPAAPARDASGSAPSSPPLPLGYRPRRSRETGFGQPALAHLALALRLCQILADLIPARYRPPHAIQLDIDSRLDRRERALVDHLAREFEAAREAPATAGGPATSRAASRADLPESVARHLIAIGDAIDAAASITIDYLAASAGEAATRVVDPLTIEWRGRVPYLIAFCHTSRANRTYRVDRILRIYPIT